MKYINFKTVSNNNEKQLFVKPSKQQIASFIDQEITLLINKLKEMCNNPADSSIQLLNNYLKYDLKNSYCELIHNEKVKEKASIEIQGDEAFYYELFKTLDNIDNTLRHHKANSLILKNGELVKISKEEEEKIDANYVYKDFIFNNIIPLIISGIMFTHYWRFPIF